MFIRSLWCQNIDIIWIFVVLIFIIIWNKLVKFQWQRIKELNRAWQYDTYQLEMELLHWVFNLPLRMDCTPKNLSENSCTMFQQFVCQWKDWNRRSKCEEITKQTKRKRRFKQKSHLFSKQSLRLLFSDGFCRTEAILDTG